MMNDEEDDIDLIEAYLKGELTGSSLEMFNKRRSKDAAFDSKVVEYSLIIGELRKSGEQQFRSTLQEWEAEISSTDTKPNVVPMWRIVSIAATVLIFALAGGYLVLNTSSSKNQDVLFNQYFEPSDDMISSRSGGGSNLQTGMTLYNEKKYAEAIPYLTKATHDEPDNTAIPCYLGISYLADNNPNAAREIFEPLAKSEPGLYREIAQWNLALAYFKSDEAALLKQTLDEIANESGHMYSKQAKTLLSEL